jgi:NADH-quinone oxidoreductase subunit A
VLFDVEVAFLIPWAVSFREMSAEGGVGWWAFLSMALFLGTLMGGLVYLVRRGALEWE